LVDAGGARSRATRGTRGDRGASVDSRVFRTRREAAPAAVALSRLSRAEPDLRRHLLAELRLDRPGCRGLRARGRVPALFGDAPPPVREGTCPGARAAARSVARVIRSGPILHVQACRLARRARQVARDRSRVAPE